jgi:adenine/guanine phosphoribosyltransferase-like PRPP-binding protein
MQSARKAQGTRDPSVLVEHYVVGHPDISDGPRFVFIDDVFTSGGHLIAARAAMKQAGHDVNDAICAGESVKIEEPQAFRISKKELADLDE